MAEIGPKLAKLRPISTTFGPTLTGNELSSEVDLVGPELGHTLATWWSGMTTPLESLSEQPRAHLHVKVPVADVSGLPLGISVRHMGVSIRVGMHASAAMPPFRGASCASWPRTEPPAGMLLPVAGPRRRRGAAGRPAARDALRSPQLLAALGAAGPHSAGHPPRRLGLARRSRGEGDPWHGLTPAVSDRASCAAPAQAREGERMRPC